MGLSLFQRLFLISTPFVALSSLPRHWIVINCSAVKFGCFKLPPSFRIVWSDPGHFQIADLPGQVTPGSCDFPGLRIPSGLPSRRLGLGPRTTS